MTVVVALLGLIFLIVIHELGHMLTAKALGVRVPEFGVGFGPALVKKKIGKTVYSFRIILLGGFAKMAGMGDVAEGPHHTCWARGQPPRGRRHTGLCLHVSGCCNRYEAGRECCRTRFDGAGGWDQARRQDREPGWQSGRDLERFRRPDVGPGGW